MVVKKALSTIIIGMSLVLTSCGNDPKAFHPITWGSSSAPHTIEAYLDFQCPGCQTFFEENFSLLKKEFIDTGKVKFVFMDYPAKINSNNAHLAFHCADEQGMAMDMAKLLFSSQDQNTLGMYKLHAKSIGINLEQFQTCISEERYLDRINTHKALGQQKKINYTPAVFIDGTRLPSLGGYAEIRKTLLQVVE